MALWVATPKDIGFAAYHRGDPRCMNTMCPGTPESIGWFEGWDQAEAQAAETARIVAARMDSTAAA